MSTLSNVIQENGRNDSPYISFTASVSPKNTTDGVSVEYAPDPNKEWYVMRATYHREKKAYDYLIAKDKEVKPYLPVRRRFKITNGKRRLFIEPLLPNLLFLYATPEGIEPYIKKKIRAFFP